MVFFLFPPFMIYFSWCFNWNPARWLMQVSGFKQSLLLNDDKTVTCYSIVWILYTRRFNVYHPQCHRDQRFPWPRPQHRLRHPGASFGDLMPDRPFSLICYRAPWKVLPMCPLSVNCPTAYKTRRVLHAKYTIQNKVYLPVIENLFFSHFGIMPFWEFLILFDLI